MNLDHVNKERKRYSNFHNMIRMIRNGEPEFIVCSIMLIEGYTWVALYAIFQICGSLESSKEHISSFCLYCESVLWKIEFGVFETEWIVKTHYVNQ